MNSWKVMNSPNFRKCPPCFVTYCNFNHLSKLRTTFPSWKHWLSLWSFVHFLNSIKCRVVPHKWTYIIFILYCKLIQISSNILIHKKQPLECWNCSIFLHCSKHMWLPINAQGLNIGPLVFYVLFYLWHVPIFHYFVRLFYFLLL